MTGAHPAQPHPPLRLTVVVGGAPGSGKTTLARRLGPARSPEPCRAPATAAGIRLRGPGGGPQSIESPRPLCPSP